MPTDLLLKSMNALHRSIRRASRGRFGWRVAGMPVLELTTIGRRSGRRHTVLLTSPTSMAGAPVVVASRGGDDRHPAWFWNITAEPLVEVRTDGGRARRMRARVATPAERGTLWPEIIAKHQRYAGYQGKTDRQIPLVILTPAGRRPAVPPRPAG